MSWQLSGCFLVLKSHYWWNMIKQHPHDCDETIYFNKQEVMLLWALICYIEPQIKLDFELVGWATETSWLQISAAIWKGEYAIQNYFLIFCGLNSKSKILALRDMIINCSLTLSQIGAQRQRCTHILVTEATDGCMYLTNDLTAVFNLYARLNTTTVQHLL